MEITRTQLGNNLNVLIINKPHLPTVTLQFLTKAGSINDPATKNGTCMLTHRMNRRGSKRYPDTQKLNLEIEKIGANIGSSSTKEITGFEITAEKRFLHNICELLSEILTNPIDKKTDLEKEKTILASEIKNLENDPKEYIGVLFSKQIFKGSKLANLSLGKISHIKKIQVNDIKKFREYYFRQSSVLAICGDFKNISDVKRILDQYFTFKLTKAKHKKLKFTKSKNYYKYKNKDIQQPIFVLGSYGPNFTSSDFYAYSLARTLLGVGFGSKITNIIREKLHLAYYSYSFFAPTSTIGTGGVLAGVFDQKLGDAIEAAKKLLKRLAKGTFSDKDLRRAKGFYEGLLTFQQESSACICSFYANQLMLQHKIKTFDQISKQINKYSKSDITKIFKKYFSDKLYLALISKKKYAADPDKTK